MGPATRWFAGLLVATADAEPESAHTEARAVAGRLEAAGRRGRAAPPGGMRSPVTEVPHVVPGTPHGFLRGMRLGQVMQAQTAAGRAQPAIPRRPRRRPGWAPSGRRRAPPEHLGSDVPRRLHPAQRPPGGAPGGPLDPSAAP